MLERIGIHFESRAKTRFANRANIAECVADADLVIGERYGSSPTGSFRAGMEIVLFGSTFSDGFESQGTSYWSAVAP